MECTIPIVLVIFVDTTVPVNIRPLIETSPTNGHFLSMYSPSIASLGVLKPRPTSLNHLFGFAPDFREPLALVKICGCFWNALCACTTSSPLMIPVYDDVLSSLLNKKC